MLFGSANTLKKYEHLKKISAGSSGIGIVTVMRNLGVNVDDKLSMKNHILYVVRTCNYHIRNIAFIRKYLSEDTLKTVICNLIISRLEYCNSVYDGVPNYLLRKLRNVQNRAASIIKGLR